MPTPVTLYAVFDAELSFYATADATPLEFELADGYRIGEGLGGAKMIFGAPGELGMNLDTALERGILRAVFDRRIASTKDDG